MMESKTYRTYDEINKDLEILKMEKDLAYHKLVRSFDDTKDNLAPMNMIGSVPKAAIRLLGIIPGPVKSMGLTYLLKKIFK